MNQKWITYFSCETIMIPGFQTKEWVSDCCLTQLSNFLAISWREQVNFQWNDDNVHFVLDQCA
jgi:hypothetical protein